MRKKSRTEEKLECLESIMSNFQDFYKVLEEEKEEPNLLNALNQSFGVLVSIDNYWKMLINKENKLVSQFKVLKFDDDGNCINL